MHTFSQPIRAGALLLLVGLLMLANTSFGQVYEWTKTLQTSSQTAIQKMAIDSSGHKYLAGFFNDTLSFNGLPDLTEPDHNAFVIKADSVGTPIWVSGLDINMFYSSQWIFAGNRLSDMDVDEQGNIYVSGTCRDYVSVGGTTLTNPHFPDYEYTGFLLKYNTQGQVAWMRLFSGNTEGVNYCHSVDVDLNGNVIITGSYQDSVQLDSATVLTGADSVTNMFIAKFSATGDLQWARDLPGDYWVNAAGTFTTDVVSDDAGAIYWYGYSNGVFMLDGFQFQTGNFLAKFSPTGQIQWHHRMSGAGARGTTLDMDGNNRLYAILNVNGSFWLGGQQYSNGIGKDNILVLALDTSGTVQWHNWIYTETGGALDREYITVSDTGYVYVGGNYNRNWQLHTNDGPGLVATSSGGTGYFFAAFLPDGTVESVQPFPETYVFMYDMLADNNKRVYATGTVGSTTGFGADTIEVLQNHAEPFYTQMITGINALAGQAFIDANTNGVYDSTDVPAEVLIRIRPHGMLTAVQPSSWFRANLSWNTANISVLNPMKHYTVLPDSHSISFVAPQHTDSSSVFALQPTPNVQDLRVSVTPFTAATPPGGLFRIKLTCENVGTVPESATLIYEYDTTLTLDTTFTPLASHVGNALTWNVGTLNPFQKESVFAYFRVPTTAQMGDTIRGDAQVLPWITDADTLDNTDSIGDYLVGPYDPNDKQVLPSGFITPNQVANGQWLTYTIRFQNTGTDTAINVVIRDTLSQLLDLTTFQVLDASDAYAIELEDYQMAFVFENIQLPDSNVNEPESHGFIKYRIKVKSSAVLGDEILNTAHIYFDFNPAIVTNTTNTPVDTIVIDTMTTQVALQRALAPWMRIYPNPGDGRVSIMALDLPAGPVELVAYSILGREIGRWSFDTAQALHKLQIQLPGTDQVVLLKLRHANGELTRTYLRSR